MADFGTPAELAPTYQAELAAGALRGLSRRALLIAVVLTLGGDLTWRGSSESGGPPPPPGYQVLAASMDGIWLVVGGLARVRAAVRPGRAAGRRGRGTGRRSR